MSPASRRKRRALLALAIVGALLMLLYAYAENNVKTPLVHLATIRLKQIATQTINAAVTEQIARESKLDKVIDWRTDGNGKTAGFTLNPTEQIRLTSETIKTVEKQLAALRERSEHIPLGQALGSPILASFGPNIPIRIVPEGAAKVDLNTRVQNAGINMILVEVFVRIQLQVAVVVPFDSEIETVETELPVFSSLVVGDVPAYYFDAKGNAVGPNAPPPGIALPGAALPSR